MASNTGIALLSMYDDEDDDMEDLHENQQQLHGEDEDMDEDKEGFVGSDATPQVVVESFPIEAAKSVSLTHGEAQINGASIIVQRRSKRGTVTIVDYGHDEVAMSPEAEEGEISGMDGALPIANCNFPEETTGMIQTLTPNTRDSSQISGLIDASQAVTLNTTARESEPTEVEDGLNIKETSSKDVDPLEWFLPPPPEEKCSDESQARINKYLAYKRAGKSYNTEVRNKKDYRNPDFLLHAVTYQDIDQIGSCFTKDVFDPHGYDKSDYFDEIEADFKREMERKELERKKTPKVEFSSGGVQSGTVVTAPKVGAPSPVPSVADVVSRDGRQNKKSKWDKVDGDRRSSLPPVGQDSKSNLGVHSAMLSATTAGSGYTAFAQQRRREAEEKISIERR